MTLAGIELRYLVNDISERTKDYYLSNIYGITKNSLLFKFHHPEKPDILLMLSTFGIWITNVKIEQIEPNKLLRRLRNDLRRFKLKEIKQIGTERIAYLTFSYSDKEFIIIGEFFGDGNIILCNSEMKILALLYSVSVRHRQLRVGSQYVPPPQDNLDVLNMTEKDFGEIRFTSTPVARWIGRTLGLPRKYAEEITRLANVESKKMGEEISNDEVKKLFDVATKITSTCVRIPVLVSHSLSANVEFNRKHNLDEIKNVLSTSPGCKLVDEHKDGGYITPVEAENKFETFISRIREDKSQPNSINLWIVSDNLLKGAALNAVEIAEALIEKDFYGK